MAAARRIPGEGGVWVLIGGDLAVFALFFLIVSHDRADARDAFAAGARALSTGLGLANTLVLLTSSLLVALGMERLRAGRPGAPARFLGAAGLGAAFVVVKAFEYGAKIAAGITPLTGDFFLYYYAFTGIHLAHVLLGIGALLAMALHARTRIGAALSDGGLPHRARIDLIECGGLFWHLVDLLWIMLFALFYLAARHG